MRLRFLGTAGATVIPGPTCACRVCQEAREKGPPYSRYGPALFVEGVNALFDTPLEISVQLNRAGIARVDHVFYTHWHPDHTAGLRVLEQLSINRQGVGKWQDFHTTPVYLPTRVKQDFEKRLGLMEHLNYLERLKLVEVRELKEGETVQMGGIGMQPVPMTNPSLCAYLLTEGEVRVLCALDDTKDWWPGGELRGVDLAVLETGWFEKDPQGRLIMPSDHPLRQIKSSFEETLQRIERLQPKRTILTHIEEMNARSYDDYLELEQRYARHNLTFAHDGLRVEV